MDYKQAGVNIEEGYRAVNQYKELAAKTINGRAANAVLNKIGSFAGMYSLKEFFTNGKVDGKADDKADTAMEEPVLVSGTDGVGTKLEVAFRMKKYDTVGIDCVAMCVNDVLCHGARPLFFLDYLACGKLDADVAAEIVKGVAIGCRETGAVLLGGETAEMPGFYDAGKYDIAGFCVGIVDRKKIVDGAKIREGDTLLGIASSGPHSSGFSLIRKVLPNLDEDFGGIPLGMALLEPTRLYVKPVISLMEKIEIHGMAHITGGGFYENIPRMFSSPPEADSLGVLDPAQNSSHHIFSAVIHKGSWAIPPIFEKIGAACNGTNGSNHVGANMFNTFNMGIGFVLALAPANVRQAIEHLDDMGFPSWEIGHVEKTDSTGLRFA
jgi:phosphoribosylformylglycinamidine cyclo-ligase